MKSENENLVEKIRGNNIKKNAERKNNFKVWKVGRENPVNLNRTSSILNCNKKDSYSINVNINHTDSNQPIPADPTNIG